MKIFKHKTLAGHRVSRNALRHYSLYRRSAIGGNQTFQDLENFHRYETTGVLPEEINSFTEFSMSNAFANGKWMMRLTQNQIFQDIHDGNFVKAEFINSCDQDKELAKVFGIKEYQSNNFKFSASGWFTKKLVESMNSSYITPFWHNAERKQLQEDPNLVEQKEFGTTCKVRNLINVLQIKWQKFLSYLSNIGHYFRKS